MSSSANTQPRLELPNWLPLPVADEAKFLYDSAIKSNQTVERHVDEPDQTVRLKSTEEASRVHYGADPANSRLEAVYQAIDAHQERAAEILRSMTFEQIELLCRLTSDERMKNVWRELYRKTRGGKQFLNPAKRVFAEASRGLLDLQNQHMAVREFFSNAFGHAAWPTPLLTGDDYKSRRKSFITMAARLREEAQNLRLLGLSEFAPNLETIAMACEERGPGLVPVHHPIVTRSRGDEVVRGFVLRMNFICHILFDKELHGTVATTAGVAFSKEISGNQVRDIVRAHDSSAAPTDIWLTTV